MVKFTKKIEFGQYQAENSKNLTKISELKNKSIITGNGQDLNHKCKTSSLVLIQLTKAYK